MPAYHSSQSSKGSNKACGCALLGFKKEYSKGNAPSFDGEGNDIIDEALNFFKANVLFKNYDIKNSSDRTLVYLTMFVTMLLKNFEKHQDKAGAEKVVRTLAADNFALPGDSKFVSNTYFPAPKGRTEGENWRSYMSQARLELGMRLIQRVYKDDNRDKFWMCFSKRRFMNKTMHS